MMVLGRNQIMPYKERLKHSHLVIHYRQCLIEIGKWQKKILVEKEKQLDVFISLCGKKKLPSTCRIGENIFTSMAIIGGKLYRNHPKNLNHVHEYTKDLVSVIITLGEYIS